MSTIDVEGVFFINLDSRTDRLENITRQVRDCHWDVSRISAIRLEDEIGDLVLKLQPHLGDKVHVASIWLSHQKALKAALKNSNNGAIILLEDDVRVSDQFWSDKLQLPDNLPEDWEIIFFSPRYRVNKNGPLKDYNGKKWLDAPHGTEPVLLRSLRGKYVMTGAHFVVFKDSQVIRKVLDRMALTNEVYDVDRFYLAEFNTYGIDNKKIGTGPFGSDHD